MNTETVGGDEIASPTIGEKREAIGASVYALAVRTTCAASCSSARPSMRVRMSR